MNKFLLFIFVLFVGTFSQRVLELSIRQVGIVREAGYTQYYIPQIPQLSDTNKFVITAFPRSGDFELYVSTQTNATRQTFNWKSTHSGPNSISLSKTTPGITNGPYYISVYGVWRTNFVILAYIDDGAEIRVYNGSPQVAQVDAGKYLYFRFRLTQNISFAIGVTPVTGDPDIYIDTIAKPTSTRRKWASGAVGADVVTIRNNDPNFIFGPEVFYYVGVYGYSNSQFQIAVTYINGTEILSEGLPHAKEVYTSGQQYFAYQLSAFKDFWIEVRPRTLGNVPNLCISATVQRPRPQDGTCTWSVSGWSGNAFTWIRRQDPNYKNETYYIGVSGWPRDWEQTRVRFMVTAATVLRSRILIDGISYNQVARNNTYQYFRIYHGWNRLRLSIDATILAGYVELYVSNDPTNTHPTKDQYNFVSSFRSSVSSVTIPQGEKEGWYYIGVLPYGRSNYTIRATTNATQTELVKGETQYYFSLPSGFYKYYYYDISKELATLNQDVTIACHFYSGYGSIHVGINPRPTEDNAKWSSYWTQLTISAKELREAKAPILYIGIKGEDNTQNFFSILLYFSNTPIQLLAGRTLEGRVLYGQYMNYVYKNTQGGRIRVTLTINNNNDDNRDADMYADTLPNPNTERYTWRSSWWGPKSIVIPDPYSNQDYYFSIQGTSISRNSTRYSLRVAVDFETLMDGYKPYQDDVDIGKFRYFQVRIPSWADRFMVSTTLINGYTEMYMMKGESEPNRDNYTLADFGWPSNTIYLKKGDEEWSSGIWTIAIYGVENSDFFIGSQSDWGELSPGIPSTGSATNQDYIYYWSMIDPTKNLFISVKIFDQVCMRVFASQTFDKPNNYSNSDWTATSDRLNQNQISLTIPAKDLDQSSPWIYFGVRTCRNVLPDWRYPFEITLTYEGLPIYLSQEVNSMYSMDAQNGQRPWFIVNSYNHATGFNFILDSCTSRSVEQIIGTFNDSRNFPITPRRDTFSSKIVNKYSQAINLVGDQFKNKRIMLSVNQPMTRQYSIFSNTKDYDTRPILKTFKSHYIRRTQKDGKTIDIHSLDIPIVSSDYYPLFYEIYQLDQSIPGINMYTVCGIRNTNASKIIKSETVWEPKALSYNVEFDATQNHVVVIVMTDWFYRTAASNVLFFNYQDRPVDQDRFDFPIGGFFILLVALLIVVYLIFGMVIKKFVYKSNGINLIPNVTFWMDTPFLFIDGIKFVITCGRRSNVAYEETTSTTPNPTNPEGEQNPFGNSGYGSI